MAAAGILRLEGSSGHSRADDDMGVSLLLKAGFEPSRGEGNPMHPCQQGG